MDDFDLEPTSRTSDGLVPPHRAGVHVAPLDVDGVRTVEVGTVLWGLAFVALLPFYSSLEEAGNLWWLWTCTAGLGLGLLGTEYCRRRRDRVLEASRTATTTTIPAVQARGPQPKVKAKGNKGRRGRGGDAGGTGSGGGRRKLV